MISQKYSWMDCLHRMHFKMLSVCSWKYYLYLSFTDILFYAFDIICLFHWLWIRDINFFVWMCKLPQIGIKITDMIERDVYSSTIQIISSYMTLSHLLLYIKIQFNAKGISLDFVLNTFEMCIEFTYMVRLNQIGNWDRHCCFFSNQDKNSSHDKRNNIRNCTCISDCSSV